MPDYRLYFMDAKGAIKAREEFTAPCDEDAAAVSAVIADACSEHYARYEVWSFARLVVKGPNVGTAPLTVSLEEMRRSRQELALHLEDSIQRSRWRIAQSQRLLEKTNELRELLGTKKAS